MRRRETKIITYIADDGTEFEEGLDCAIYEATQLVTKALVDEQQADDNSGYIKTVAAVVDALLRAPTLAVIIRPREQVGQTGGTKG